MAEDDKTTIGDLLESWEEMETIVGPASSDACSYNDGYVARQAVFCCLDCTPVTGVETAGFCYACSLHCHEDHNVEMLYTKRNFRCDCGTIPHQICNLQEKPGRNDKNKYNHNFQGKYCFCDRPYPDPENTDTKDSEMYQCVLCEDWFHSVHLNNTLPADFEEMICQDCITKYPFLAYYRLQDESVDGVVSSPEKDSAKSTSSSRSVGRNTRKRSSESSLTGPSKRARVCKLPAKITSYGKACFFGENFRSDLCSCKDCVKLYKEKKIEFLTKDTDTLNHYDSQAQDLRKGRENEIDSFMSSISHEARCDVARAIGGLKDVLKTVLGQCIDNDDITPEQVKASFEDLIEKRKKDF